jgi:hypothetical protein
MNEVDKISLIVQEFPPFKEYFHVTESIGSVVTRTVCSSLTNEVEGGKLTTIPYGPVKSMITTDPFEIIALSFPPALVHATFIPFAIYVPSTRAKDSKEMGLVVHVLPLFKEYFHEAAVGGRVTETVFSR